MWGRLTLNALPDDPFTLGALITTAIIGSLGLMLLLKVKGLPWIAKTAGYIWREWLTSLDPKRIGVMYITVAILMLFRGAADAAMMRLQQALSVGENNGILSADTFQQVFTAHGSIMIFFVAMGLMFGLINILVPLQIGARDVAFPFMNSVSFWLFVAGAMLVNTSLVIGEFAATGWLAYPPLSGIVYSPGVGVDYWIWGLQIAGVGSLLSGINFFVTIIKLRAPGMTMMRMPIFVWSVLGSMSLILFAFPILTATLALLGLDRTIGTHFFTTDLGGNAMLYINLIWAWGHPEVYILILPAFGIFSEIVATFSKKRLFGYTSMVWALASITFLSFLVWLHHFFTMGAGANVNAFFGIMTMIISIPTGVKIFNWLFTMYRGRIRLTAAMLWFLGFVLTFTIGGATGVMMSIPALDFQLHNSLFLVAHFHNMVIGGVLFGYFAGLTYWFPKIFGFTLHETLGKASFWLWIAGFCMAFIPLYILGIMGATRRLNTYSPETGWQGLFIVAGIGVLIIGLAIATQVLQVIVSIIERKKNRDTTGDPWDGRTLEWSTPSPAPVYNFARIPHVTTRDAFWHAKQYPAKTIQKHYDDIHLPKNSSLGIYFAGLLFVAGFSIVWHIWWLALVSLIGALCVLILRSFDEHPEYTISGSSIAVLETRRQRSNNS